MCDHHPDLTAGPLHIYGIYIFVSGEISLAVINLCFPAGNPRRTSSSGFPVFLNGTDDRPSHLGYNLLLILPFGILVEKVIGSKRFLALFASTWIVDVILNFIMGVIYTKDGESFAVSGASGLAFSFMPVGVYILCVMAKRYGFGKLFRQVSFYLLMGIALPTAVISLIPNIAGVAGIPSMIIHLIALAIGVVFAFICKGKIACFFNNTNVKYSVQEYGQ